MKRLLLPIALCFFAAACDEQTARVLLDPPEIAGAQSAQTIRLPLSTIELKDVALPAHASGPDVLMQTEEGALTEIGESVWADEPVRAITGMIAKQLDEGSSATVAAEPWPLFDRAQAELVVRVDRMLAQSDGRFALSAQVAVTSSDRIVNDRIERFSITTDLPSPDAAGVAKATSTAIGLLSNKILQMLSGAKAG